MKEAMKIQENAEKNIWSALRARWFTANPGKLNALLHNEYIVGFIKKIPKN